MEVIPNNNPVMLSPMAFDAHGDTRCFKTHSQQSPIQIADIMKKLCSGYGILQEVEEARFFVL